jgi:uncharacterized DUF497 family protein
MRFDWDEAKRRQNIKAHGIDFTAVYRFNWALAERTIDDREDYGELREKAVGFIGDVLHALIFTERHDGDDDLIWVISLRKANRMERTKYERERPS